MTPSALLKHLGLNRREIQVYLKGLELGPSLARQLALSTGLSRTLTYHALDGLEEKGLASLSGKQYKTLYHMEPKERLARMIKRRRKELERVEKQLDKLPELLAISESTRSEPSVRVYRGLEGLKHVARESVEAKEGMVRSLVSIKEVADTMSQSFLSEWIGDIKERGIQSKSLWTVQNINPLYQTGLRDLRILPEGIKLPAGLLIYDDTVLLFTPKPDIVGVIIKQKDIAQSMKALHDLMWEQSSPISS